jgi:ankyrin repeat protein
MMMIILSTTIVILLIIIGGGIRYYLRANNEDIKHQTAIEIDSTHNESDSVVTTEISDTGSTEAEAEEGDEIEQELSQEEEIPSEEEEESDITTSQYNFNSSNDMDSIEYYIEYQDPHLCNVPIEVIAYIIVNYCSVCEILSLARTCRSWYKVFGNIKPTSDMFLHCFNAISTYENPEQTAIYFIENGYFSPDAFNNIALYEGCSRNYVDLVRYILDNVDNLSQVEFSLMLSRSCSQNNLDITDLLLTKMTKKNRTRMDLLFTSSAVYDEFVIADNFAFYDTLDLFLRIGAIQFSQKDYPELVACILDHGSNYFSVLDFASAFGFIEVVRAVLDQMRVIKDYDNEALALACANGYYEIVEMMLNDSRFDPSYNDNSALLSAVVEKEYSIWTLLLDRKYTDPNYDDGMLLKKAVAAGNYEFVERVLFKDKSAPLNTGENVALFYALTTGNIELANSLLRNPLVNPGDRDGKFLLMAFKHGYTGIAEQILNRIYVSDQLLCRLLHEACSKKNIKLVSVILEQLKHRDIEEDGQSRKGYNSSLETASRKGYTDIVRLLLSCEQFQSVSSQSLIEACKRQDNTEIIQLLLDHDQIDPTFKNSDCLIEACKAKAVETVELLLKDGRADPTSRNSDCLIEVAKTCHPRILSLLLRDGRADPSANESECLARCIQSLSGECVRLLLQDGRSDIHSFKCKDALMHQRVVKSHIPALVEDFYQDDQQQ